MSKIVIGKPATVADASNGYMDPMTMASCLSQAKDQKWGKRSCLIPGIRCLIASTKTSWRCYDLAGGHNRPVSHFHTKY